MKDKVVTIKWVDSYTEGGGRWFDFEDDYSPEICTVTSWGKVIFEDDKIIALAHNYADIPDKTL